MFNSLSITRFRCFRELTIPQLSRVNLIVGRNNAGKTMLLEALRLYLASGSPTAIRSLLVSRDEVVPSFTNDDDESDAALRVESLFFNNEAKLGEGWAIRIGPLNDPYSTLELRLEPVVRRSFGSSPRAYGTSEYRYEIATASDTPTEPLQLGLVISQFNSTRLLPLAVLAGDRRRPIGLPGHFRSRAPFIPANGIAGPEIARWWDSVTLRDAEQRVVQCLRIIAPVERISLVEHPMSRSNRMVLLKMEGKKEPIPLRSLGDGMSRIFQIALALESGQEDSLLGGSHAGQALLPEFEKVIPQTPTRKVLLVDEIENGLHYTALPHLWRFIFNAARLHDIQVFATSHSWDCIQAFQTAASEDEASEGTLIRLERDEEGSSRAVTFSEEELRIVARENIEVR